MLKKLNLAI